MDKIMSSVASFIQIIWCPERYSAISRHSLTVEYWVSEKLMPTVCKISLDDIETIVDGRIIFHDNKHVETREETYESLEDYVSSCRSQQDYNERELQRKGRKGRRRPPRGEENVHTGSSMKVSLNVKKIIRNFEFFARSQSSTNTSRMRQCCWMPNQPSPIL